MVNPSTSQLQFTESLPGINMVNSHFSQKPLSVTSKRVKNIMLALGWYYPEMHRGVARYARENNWHITFDFDDPVPENWEGDGVLTLLAAGKDLWQTLKNFQGPIVDLGESQPDIPLPRVTMDNHQIGQLAAEFYLERGFRHFAFIHRWDLGVSKRRREGFEQKLNNAGYDCHLLCWQNERNQKVDTRQQRIIWLKKRLSQLPKPLAVFSTWDIIAAEVIEACIRSELAVPEQVAVLGVDNAEVICECLQIPMSSIDNNLELVGYEGAALLDQIIEGRVAPELPQYIPPVGVVERRSTDYLAVDHPQVAAALHFIHKQYHRHISMRDILAGIPMSRSGLEKAFREHYVRPPMEELRRVRFQKTQKLLAETDDKITSIAKQTGFVTSHNLCRSFKRHFGITPKQYREKFQQQQ